MLHSLSRNLIFVHIHKTGGTSFRTFLQRNILDVEESVELPQPHHSVDEVYRCWRLRGRDPAQLRIISLVRHPLAQVASVYRFYRGLTSGSAETFLPHVQAARRCSFPEFVRGNIFYDVFAKMLLVKGVLPPNVHLIRLEEFSRDAEQVLNERLGLRLELDFPHLNRSKSEEVDKSYTPEMIELVRKISPWCFAAGLYD